MKNRRRIQHHDPFFHLDSITAELASRACDRAAGACGIVIGRFPVLTLPVQAFSGPESGVKCSPSVELLHIIQSNNSARTTTYLTRDTSSAPDTSESEIGHKEDSTAHACHCARRRAYPLIYSDADAAREGCTLGVRERDAVHRRRDDQTRDFVHSLRPH